MTTRTDGCPPVLGDYGNGWSQAKPLKAPWYVRWQCDHHWHLEPRQICAIDWFCCRCSQEREHNDPKNGPTRHVFARLWRRTHRPQA